MMSLLDDSVHKRIEMVVTNTNRYQFEDKTLQSYYGDLWEFAEKIKAAQNSRDVDDTDERVKELFADGIHHTLTRGTIKQRKLNLFSSFGVLNQAEAVFEATATVSAYNRYRETYRTCAELCQTENGKPRSGATKMGLARIANHGMPQPTGRTTTAHNNTPLHNINRSRAPGSSTGRNRYSNPTSSDEESERD
jgi:hypothetical protein